VSYRYRSDTDTGSRLRDVRLTPIKKNTRPVRNQLGITCVASCSVSIAVTSKGESSRARGSCLWIRLIRFTGKGDHGYLVDLSSPPFQDDGGRYATSRRASPRALRSMQQVAQNNGWTIAQSLGTGTDDSISQCFLSLGAKSACRTGPSILLIELLWLFITKLPILTLSYHFRVSRH
jgi:hypothetical protein